ncbi:hypothetical protein GGX14DRAFT_572854 [Mycena pura]|uniref:Uncharacterized protein n=1 Tax=Mycena pura TaxID=153505 RepID=A0AAD6V369_9AGAR|nr:hypothetical protein GGX14DRAFT_572854 [Mycena pura]
MFSNGYKVNMERWEGRGSRGGAVGAVNGAPIPSPLVHPAPTSTPSPCLQHILNNHVTPPATPTAHGARLAARPPSYTTHPTVRGPCSLPLPSTLHSAPAAARSRKCKTHRTARDKDVTARCPLAVCRAQLVSCQLPAALFPFPPPPASRHLLYVPLPARRTPPCRGKPDSRHSRPRPLPARRTRMRRAAYASRRTLLTSATCPFLAARRPCTCPTPPAAHVAGQRRRTPLLVVWSPLSVSPAARGRMPQNIRLAASAPTPRLRPIHRSVCAARARHAAFTHHTHAPIRVRADWVLTHAPPLTHATLPVLSTPGSGHARAVLRVQLVLGLGLRPQRTRRADFAEREDLASVSRGIFQL